MKINGNPDGGGGREPIVESLSVTQNGIYTPEPGVDGFDNVDVNVPAPEFVTETLSVSVNNTYYPGQGVNGFSQVIVDVPQSVEGFTEKEVTEKAFPIVNLNNSASFVASSIFQSNTSLQTVNLPNASIIYNHAFYNCQSLTQVNLPNCEVVSGQAFYNCQSLTQVSLPNCTEIGTNNNANDRINAFANCTSLTKIDLPTCKTIGNTAFANCTSLSQISLPVCEYIGEKAFISCYSLESINLPVCSTIWTSAFIKCSSLSQVSIPVCMVILNSAFDGCSSLSQINLSTCFSLGSANTFRSCTSLEEITLNMNNYVRFSYSNMLTGTKIADGTGSIYVQANDYDWYISAPGWSSLSARFVSVPGPVMLSYSDGLVYGQTKVLDYYFPSYFGVNYASIKGISLPNCTYVQPKPGTNPPPYPIKECANLQTLVLGVSEIYNAMCERRYSLQYVELSNCKHLGYGAFSACTSLSQISLPECESIDNFAFIQCSALQSIDLPKCTSLGSDVFRYCSSLSSVNLPILKSLNNNSSIFEHCSNLTYISLPECEYIGSGTNFNYLPLQSIDLPKCSYIGGVFFHCASLSQVSLPECEYLGYQTFRECNLQSIDLPKCSFIDSGAFASNVSFSEITLRSNTVCSLMDIMWTFNDTPLRNGNGSIYVPASLVDAYKADSIWSKLASQIFPIPE